MDGAGVAFVIVGRVGGEIGIGISILGEGILVLGNGIIVGAVVVVVVVIGALAVAGGVIGNVVEATGGVKYWEECIFGVLVIVLMVNVG